MSVTFHAALSVPDAQFIETIRMMVDDKSGLCLRLWSSSSYGWVILRDGSMVITSFCTMISLKMHPFGRLILKSRQHLMIHWINRRSILLNK